MNIHCVSVCWRRDCGDCMRKEIGGGTGGWLYVCEGECVQVGVC